MAYQRHPPTSQTLNDGVDTIHIEGPDADVGERGTTTPFDSHMQAPRSLTVVLRQVRPATGQKINNNYSQYRPEIGQMAGAPAPGLHLAPVRLFKN